jgi:hypothetical protein
MSSDDPRLPLDDLRSPLIAPLMASLIASLNISMITFLIASQIASHRLRAAQAEQRRAAVAKAAALKEAVDQLRAAGAEEDDIKAAARKAAEAAADSEALQVFTFWRAVSGLNPVEYKQRGSSELAFLSLTKRKSVAEKYVDETLSGRNPEWTKP